MQKGIGREQKQWKDLFYHVGLANHYAKFWMFYVSLLAVMESFKL